MGMLLHYGYGVGYGVRPYEIQSNIEQRVNVGDMTPIKHSTLTTLTLISVIEFNVDDGTPIKHSTLTTLTLISDIESMSMI